MRKIRILPESTANKIAAGEVVERPLSVVKELVENAVDADASDISLSVERGGARSVTVSDDGSGMSRDDMFLCVERHATSKLSDVAGLDEISTMGFRGEALSSIAAVSRFSIDSAAEQGAGFSLQVHGGAFHSDGAVSMSRGTRVTVRDLFYNVPVRRKFLSSEKQEFSLISRCVKQFAVVFPETAFSLSHNQRTVFTFPPGEQDRRIGDIWGLKTADLRRGNSGTEDVTVRAVVSSPLQNCYGPSVVSVNSRIISDRKINGRIFRTLRQVVGKDARTAHALFISLPYGTVDVNVHPGKQEVRFSREKQIFSLIERALKACFSSAVSAENEKHPVPDSKMSRGIRYEQAPGRSESSHRFHIHEPQPSVLDAGSAESEQNTMPEMSETAPLFGSRDNHRIAGTVMDLYVIVEKDDVLYFIDQHASHERIVYTRLREALADRSGITQTLISPVTVPLSPDQIDVLRTHAETMSGLGFIIEPFDEVSAVLRGVPAMGFETDWRVLIIEMLDELGQYGTADSWDDAFIGHVATRACHNAVRGNNVLSRSEIEQLLQDIEKETVLTCPHGRPFYFTMDRRELKKRVKRT